MTIDGHVILRMIFEAGVPLSSGIALIVLGLKRHRKSYLLLGFGLVVFSPLLVLKSYVQAAPVGVPGDAKEMSLIIDGLKAGRSFPVKIDEVTTLRSIEPTGSKKITFFYAVKQTGEIIDVLAVMEYACANFRPFFDHGYSIVFDYRDETSKNVARVVTDLKLCEKN